MDNHNMRSNRHASWSTTDQSPERERRVDNPHACAWGSDKRCAVASPVRGQRAQSRAFSLLEMMIAVVILGLGLVMVATMFPVAWSRARTLVEYTSQAAITEATHTTVDILTHVGDPPKPLGEPDLGATAGSFAGDLSYVNKTALMPDAGGNPTADTRVHVLHIENILVESDPRRIVPQPTDPWDDEFAPWKLEVPGGFSELGIAPDLACTPGTPGEKSCYASFMASQVQIESRIYPPMRARQGVDQDTGEFTGADRPWDDELDTRRYAWAVLHRLRELPAKPEVTRDFDFYYVTLKRTQSTNRFARQNPEAVPNPATPEVIVEPEALPPEDDVLFPSAWRVQILFPLTPPTKANPDDPNNPVTGLPTEVEVNIDDGDTADFVIDMFQVGTPFIDEVSGQLYHVTRLRYTDDDLEAGILTLDREVLLEDMDYLPLNQGTIVLGERIRTVWVFPPPVQAERASNDAPVFIGNHPVVGIDVRALNISPNAQ